MVIRGNTRGNGRQLAYYLLSRRENERVHILDVAGRYNSPEDYYHETLHGMSLTAELSKSSKGLYHAQINPAPQEDQRMTAEHWLQAADILGQELGLEDQRRIMVLHEKKGRTHAHVVWERYNHAQGKVVSDSFSRLAQDRARKEMERIFAHKPTPHRNPHRPELKEALTKLWQQTTTGEAFVKAARQSGYAVAAGVPRNPFMVVDENGRSFDLVRQLKGVRIKEVRERLRHETLIPEKEAIQAMRSEPSGSQGSGKVDGQQARQPQAEPEHDRTAIRDHFANIKQETTTESPETEAKKRQAKMGASFDAFRAELTRPLEPAQDDSQEKKKAVAAAFDANHITILQKPEVPASTVHPVRESFAKSEKDITAKPETPIDAAQKRKNEVAAQFTANQQSALSLEEAERKKLRQQLIEEQKAIREQHRKRRKGRAHSIILLLCSLNLQWRNPPERKLAAVDMLPPQDKYTSENRGWCNSLNR